MQKLNDLDSLCTTPEICLSLEPEDAIYFSLPDLKNEFQQLLQKYRSDLQLEISQSSQVYQEGQGQNVPSLSISKTEMEYEAALRALRDLTSKYGAKFRNLPYHVRLLACVFSRILDPRIRGLLIVQSWLPQVPDFYTLILLFVKSMCLGDAKCVDNMVEQILQEHQEINIVIQLYSNIKVARKTVEALTRYIPEAFNLLIKLGIDPRRFLIFNKLVRVVTGTSVEIPTGFGTTMTIEDTLLTQYFDLVVIGLPLGYRTMIGLSYFLDYVKILVEHCARVMNEQLMALQRIGVMINPLRFRKLDEILAHVNVVVQGIKALIRVDKLEVPNLQTLVLALHDLRRILFELEKEYEANIITMVACHGTKILEKLKGETKEREVKQQI